MSWVVEALDVVEFEYVELGFVPGPMGFAGRALGLQRRENALHRRMVADVA